MDRIKRLIIVGVIGLGLFISVLVWTQPGLNNYRSMLERAEVAVVRAELARELARRPDWTDARRLMFELELKDGNPLAALEHLQILAHAGQGQGEALALQNWMQDQGGDYPSLIDALLDIPTGVWPREMALNLALDTDGVELIFYSLSQLKAADTDNPLLRQAWDMWNHRSLGLAWQMAQVMGEDYQAMVVGRIEGTKGYELKMQMLDELLAITPRHPVLRILRAGVLGGRQGLNELLDLEEEGYKPVAPLKYGNLKFRLLTEAQVPEPSAEMQRFLQPGPLPAKLCAQYPWKMVMELENTGWAPADPEAYRAVKTDLFRREVRDNPGLVQSGTLEWLEPRVMMEMVQYWLGSQDNPGLDQQRQIAVAKVLSRLEKNDKWALQVNYLRQAFVPPTPPRPDMIICLKEIQEDHGEDLTRMWDLSPDRQHLFVHGFRTAWHHLPRGSVQIPDEHHLYQSFWSPDREHVALWPGETRQGPDHIWIYSLKIPQATLRLDTPWMIFLGWQDGSTLVFARNNLLNWNVTMYDLQSGEWIWTEGKQGRPHLTRDRKIAWVSFDEVGITLEVEGHQEKYSLIQEGEYQVYDWLDHGAGLVLEWTTDGSSSWLILAGGEVRSLDIWGFVPLRGGWIDEARVYGSYLLGQTNHLLILDANSMNLQHTGITWSRGHYTPGSLSYLRDGKLVFYFLD